MRTANVSSYPWFMGVEYVPEWTDLKKMELSPDLYRALVGLAMEYAPWDTGNLANSIRLGAMTPRFGRIIYDIRKAFYVYFLEEGKGFVKKHKGFIGDKTVPAMCDIIKMYFEYGGDMGVVGGNMKRGEMFRAIQRIKAPSNKQGKSKWGKIGYERRDPHNIFSQKSSFSSGSGINRSQRRARSVFHHQMVSLGSYEY